MCEYCNWQWWGIGTESGHWCDGTEASCASICPIPIPVQIYCPVCLWEWVLETLPKTDDNL